MEVDFAFTEIEGYVEQKADTGGVTEDSGMEGQGWRCGQGWGNLRRVVRRPSSSNRRGLLLLPALKGQVGVL